MNQDVGLRIYGYLGKALIRAGQTDEARTLLAELEQQSKFRFVSPLSAAVIHAELGETQAALELLDEAWRVRSIHLMWSLPIRSRGSTFPATASQPSTHAGQRRET